MILLEDKGNKVGAHDTKNAWWSDNGIEVCRYPLPVGDYVLSNDTIEELLARKSKRGVAVKKMDFMGTYDVAVDSKFGVQEIINNVCGRQHDRFRDEVCLAQNNGIKLYILIEDDGGYVDKKNTIFNKPITRIEDLFSWRNPRAFIYYRGQQKYPYATKGSTIAKAMLTMQEKYGCEFVFCRSKDAGAKVIELLTRDKGDSNNDG